MCRGSLPPVRAASSHASSNSRLAPKSRYRYGSEMPACRAISVVGAAQPRSANTPMAAARTSARRSSADRRFGWDVMHTALSRLVIDDPRAARRAPDTPYHQHPGADLGDVGSLTAAHLLPRPLLPPIWRELAGLARAPAPAPPWRGRGEPVVLVPGFL